MRLVNHRRIAAALLALTMSGGPAIAQQNPVTPRLSFGAALNVASRYVFRGHEKDGPGAILQPDSWVGYVVHHEPTGAIRRATVGAFAWSSAHSGTRGFQGGIGVYEVDVGISVVAELPGGWSTSFIYTAYLAPTDAFANVHEVGIEVALVSEATAVAVSPRVLLAREVSDSGGAENTYMEFGADIALPRTGPVGWLVPLVAGTSVDGLYENPAGGNELLGFVSAGFEASSVLRELGLGRSQAEISLGIDATFVNPDAHVTQDAENDVLWGAHLGLSFGL